MKTVCLCNFQKWRRTTITKYVIGLHKMLNTVCFQAHFTFSVESRFSACQSCSSFYRKPRTRLWRKLRNCSCPRNTKPRGKRNRRKSTSTTTADTWIVPKCNEPENISRMSNIYSFRTILRSFRCVAVLDTLLCKT